MEELNNKNIEIAYLPITYLKHLIEKRKDFSNWPSRDKSIPTKFFESLLFWLRFREAVILESISELIKAFAEQNIINQELFIESPLFKAWFEELISFPYKNKKLHLTPNIIVIQASLDLIHKKLIVKAGYLEYVRHYSKKELFVEFLESFFTAGLRNITNNFDSELENLLLEHNFPETMKQYTEMILIIQQGAISFQIKAFIKNIFERCIINSEKLTKEFIKIGLDKIAIQFFEINEIAKEILNKQ